MNLNMQAGLKKQDGASYGSLKLNARNKALKTLLEGGFWNEFYNEIADFSPDVIILLARKMPRIYTARGWTFRGVPVVSDFAIPWIADHINENTRVAIVDDSFNSGTTLRAVYDKIKDNVTFENVKIFTAIHKIDSDTPEKAKPSHSILLDGEDIVSDLVKRKYIINDLGQSKDENEYEDFSSNVGKAIGLLSLPYEIEFPILKASYANLAWSSEDILQSLRTRLAKFATIHDTSVKQSSEYGLARFSIDMNLNTHHNIKFRLYLDDIRKTVAIVPMSILASNAENSIFNVLYAEISGLIEKNAEKLKKFETIQGECLKRVGVYLNSLDFAYNNLFILRNIFTIDSVKLHTEDAVMLFGKEVAEKIEEEVAKHDFAHLGSDFQRDYDKESANSLSWEDINTSKFYQICFDKTNQPTPFLDGVKFLDIKTREGVFIEFFRCLAKYVGANTPLDCQVDFEDYFTKEDIEENPYLRLRIGPTFEDMLHIFRYLWQKAFDDKDIKVEDCRRILSDILDTSIDNGGIVPVIGKETVRCYRKGEVKNYDKNLYYANQWLAFLDGKNAENNCVTPRDIHKLELSPELEVVRSALLKDLHTVEL